MENKDKYNKEVIKNRMFRNASGLWGGHNVENLDPLIKLLIEALASEINKLSGEINSMETRLLERIAALLTPDILMAVRPAHMIMHAQPVEKTATIDKDSGFSLDRKHGQMPVNFYSAGNFQLVRGAVKAMICARKIFLIGEDQAKEIQARSLSRSEKFIDNLWIGLDFDAEVKSVANLSFYFELLNRENKNELLHLLPYTQWSLEGEILNTRSGIYVSDEKDDTPGEPFAGYDSANISDESIIKIYQHQFVTLTGEIQGIQEKQKQLPDELKELFADEKNSQALPSLLWIKVTFPPGFEEGIMDDFFVSINAFPVINKKMYSITHKTNKWTSVIPLDMEEHEFLLSVKSVVDSNSRQYTPLPFRNDHSELFGTYTLKRGGAERFDTRNAREYISNMIDIVREESASFAMAGKGFVNELVSKIDELIVLIQNKLEGANLSNRDITSYLIMDTNDVGETVFIDYWITNCELANNIKAGTRFSPLDSRISADTAVSLTSGYGGRNLQSNAMDMYKYMLTTRDRIYTDEDIVNFCFAQAGDAITSVSVKKGVYASLRPKEGLIRSIDVFITLKSHLSRFSGREISDKLLNLLKDKSPETYNYRVFITNQS
ncbi:MAG: hypothetical protein LBL07_04735 [Tannerella sp.]|jgi:flagellin-specific chaperone FliS|nr:hypothetical protein [Tannerella sp.]